RTSTTYFCPLSLHDALPIYDQRSIARIYLDAERAASGVSHRLGHGVWPSIARPTPDRPVVAARDQPAGRIDHHILWRGTCRQTRSEEHTSELQSLTNLVCRL